MRALRTGSIRDADEHWYTAMKRVMPASTGSSNTMSASFRPVWGRDSGRFSTLTASAGRFGTAPPGAICPVSGHLGGFLCTNLSTSPPGPLPPRARAPTATAPTMTTIPTMDDKRPRRVMAIREIPPRAVGGQRSNGRGSRTSDATRAPGPAQRPRGTSHLLKKPDSLLDGRMRREQILEPVVLFPRRPGGLVQPQVRGGVVRRSHRRVIVGDLAQGRGQARRVPREHCPVRVRQVLAAARHRQLDDLGEERGEDGEDQADHGEDCEALSPTVVVAAPPAHPAPPEPAEQ